MADALHPTAAVLMKLGSIARHIDEWSDPDGKPVDLNAALTLLKDPEVVEWMAAADAMALLPVKR